MQFFLIGLAMRSLDHDYAAVHAALFSMQARRVSVRIWLCAVEHAACEGLFSQLGQSLSDQDEMLIVELPKHMRGPRQAQIAA